MFFFALSVHPRAHNNELHQVVSTYQHSPTQCLRIVVLRVSSTTVSKSSLPYTHIVLCLQERKDEFDQQEEARKRAKAMGGAFADLQKVNALVPLYQ